MAERPRCTVCGATGFWVAVMPRFDEYRCLEHRELDVASTMCTVCGLVVRSYLDPADPRHFASAAAVAIHFAERHPDVDDVGAAVVMVPLEDAET